jgi:hypothetical protein
MVETKKSTGLILMWIAALAVLGLVIYLVWPGAGYFR